MAFLGAVFLAAQFLATLEPNTIQAFDQYVREVDTLMKARAAGPGRLSDEPEGVVATNAGKSVPHGLIHDWTARTFLPGASRVKASALLEDFPRHASVYPEVVEGRVEKREGNHMVAFHRLRKKKLLEVNLELRYSRDVLPSAANRYASRSVATEIVEVSDAGTKKEHRLPPGHDHGFLWRLQTYWILEETPKGLWMEVRSITLTRDVPTGLGWAVKPMVKELPRESLEGLMEATKRGVLKGDQVR